jgi:CheY-like chemotaxis protein
MRMSRVLVVDDSETVVNFLRMVLESEKYEVDTASDGNEGLAKAHQSLPDLIITDSIMPGDFIAKPVDETELRVRTNSQGKALRSARRRRILRVPRRYSCDTAEVQRRGREGCFRAVRP